MKLVLTVSILIVLAFAPASSADDAEARRIMEKVDAVEDGDHRVADMEMTLIDRRGNERIRRIRSFSKDRGHDTLQALFFLFPPDVEDTAFLTYDYDGGNRDDDQWLFLPALGRAKRIASSGKSGSFMGSDFNYSDLSTRELDDYDYTLVKEDEVRGHRVWVIQAVPVNRKVIDETGYEKSLLLVRQDNHVVVRAVSWVKGGEDLRYMDVVGLEQIEGIWVATEIKMTTKRGSETRHATVLKLSDVKFDQGLEDELFTVHRMEAGL